MENIAEVTSLDTSGSYELQGSYTTSWKINGILRRHSETFEMRTFPLIALRSWWHWKCVNGHHSSCVQTLNRNGSLEPHIYRFCHTLTWCCQPAPSSKVCNSQDAPDCQTIGMTLSALIGLSLEFHKILHWYWLTITQRLTPLKLKICFTHKDLQAVTFTK